MHDITTPQEFFGFRVGEDRKLAGWPEIMAYLRLLSEQSDRIIVEEIGRSTEDKPFVICKISSPANLARAEDFRSVQQSLADPRTLADEDAAALIDTARAVVAITCSIHATEVGGTQMSVELAHLLASSDDRRARSILDNVILLLAPSLNPDGLGRVKDWYDSSIGTKFEGAIPPYLYHKYTGHDNNRDWFMFTQQETRLVVDCVHNAWRPHITYDIHQTRADGMRMILPPLTDPIGPNVDPVIQSEMAALGMHMAAHLTAEGKAGVAVNVVYDSYSPSRSYPHYHGGVRVLSEAASVRIASPITVPQSALSEERGELPRTRTWNHPLPWEGGRWTLRDIVEYDLSAAMACLDHAALNRKWWVRNSYEMLRRATKDTNDPFAYIIPARQRDTSAADELEDIMRTADVQVREATDEYTVSDGTIVRPSDRVIFMQQPYGAFAKTMLERRVYPDIRQHPGGPPKRPYDATTHSLPLMMGVECHEIAEPVDIRTREARKSSSVDATQREKIFSYDAPAFAIMPQSNASARTVNELMSMGIPMLRSFAPIPIPVPDLPDGARAFPAGTWVAPSSDELRRALVADGGAVDILQDIFPLWERPEDSLELARPPRIGVYSSYVPCIEEGWTRFVLDDYGFPYTSLVDSDIREGNLEARFDCVLIPHQAVRQIHRGFNRAYYASRFSGGLGDRGLQNLREFAERGGTIIAWDDSARLLVRRLQLPATNPLAGISHSDFFAPGSLLRIRIDTGHPLGFGMPETAAALYMNGPAYRLEQGAVVASFSEEDTLLSGWLIGAQHIRGLSALASIPMGMGEFVLFGFRPHFRAQTRGTYKLLFNALYSAARP